MPPIFKNEYELEKAVVAFARKHKVFTFKLTSPSMAGMPDRFFACNGFTVFMEFKHPDGGGKVSPAQIKTFNRFEDAGLTVAVVDNYVEATRILTTELGLYT